MIDFVTALWLGMIGGCIGSFLNVVAYRMPLGMSVVWKSSHCPKCEHAIRARDNVPVLGWLMLRGKCRDCGEPISPRYAIVEFLMGAAFFILAYVELFSGGANLPGGPITEFAGAIDNFWNPQWDLIGVYAYHCTLLSLLMCVSLIAHDRQLVPNRLILTGLVAGVVPVFFFPHVHPTGLGLAPEPWNRLGGIVGSVCGFVLGISGAEAVSKLHRSLRPEADRGLIVAFVFLGAFLGWQGMITMCFVLIITALNAKFRPSAGTPNPVDTVFMMAPFHLAYWRQLVETLFS